MDKDINSSIGVTLKKLINSKNNSVMHDDFIELCKKEGYSKIVNILSEISSYEECAVYFSNIKKCRKRKIKTIATICHYSNIGGVARVNAELMNLLVKMGYNVVFFSPAKITESDYSYSKKIKRICIPDYSKVEDRLIALEKHCMEEDIDVVINHEWGNKNFIWDCILIKLLNIAFIQYCHGLFSYTFSTGKESLYQPEAFKISDVVLAISETSAKFYQMNGCNTYFVHNPIPQDLYNKKKASLDSNHVLMLGRLSKEKYPIEALEIFKRVKDKMPEIILDVVGEGNAEKEAKEFVKKNNLESAVIFHGGISVDNIDKFFLNSSCMLFTSKMEGYPMAVLESKAYGLPLISYDLPYLYLFRDKRGILTAPIGDFDVMSNYLYRLMSDNDFRNKMGEESSESFEELKKYNIEKTWNNIFKICINETVVDKDYYNPELLSDNEKYIMPVMIEMILKGYNNTFFYSKEYKLGQKLLYFPKRLKKILKKLVLFYPYTMEKKIQ